MIPLDPAFSAFMAEVSKQAMGKIFELIKGKHKFALEIKYFAISQWESSSLIEDEKSPLALMALIEITNKSDDPYHVSGFSLNISEKSFHNVFINSIKNDSVQGTLIEIKNGFKDVAFFKVKLDFFEPLWRPYLLKNQSALGLVAFKFDSHISGGSLSIAAHIAGYDTSLSERII